MIFQNRGQIGGQVGKNINGYNAQWADFSNLSLVCGEKLPKLHGAKWEDFGKLLVRV